MAPYINTNYTPDQAGLDIRDEDVVRPHNHRFTVRGDNEASGWKVKSRPRCPTYGNCELCYKSGPVAKMCNDCGRSDTTHGYIYKIQKANDVIYDAMAIAAIFHKGHETAKADRIYFWTRDPVQSFGVDHVYFGARKAFRHIEDPAIRAALIAEAEINYFNLSHDAQRHH